MILSKINSVVLSLHADLLYPKPGDRYWFRVHHHQCLAFAEAEGHAGGAEEAGGTAPQQDTVSASHLLQDLSCLCSQSPPLPWSLAWIRIKVLKWRYELTTAASLFKDALLPGSLLLNAADSQLVMCATSLESIVLLSSLTLVAGWVLCLVASQAYHHFLSFSCACTGGAGTGFQLHCIHRLPDMPLLLQMTVLLRLVGLRG